MDRLPIVLALAACLLVAPRTAAVAATEADAAQVLRVQGRYFPESLDPQQGSGVDFSTLLSANYEGLTRLDEQMNVVPAAAESWAFSPDGRTLTFQLRDNLVYSDGSPLTAERFAEAVRRACDPAVVGDYQHILFDVVGCQAFAALYTPAAGGMPVARDDTVTYEAARTRVGVRALDVQTLEIALTHPAPYFPAIAGLHLFYPAKQELIAQGGDGWSLDPALQIGNGPFQVTRFASEQVAVFEANERYWAGRPKLDRLEFVYVADSTVALEAYLTGDLDIISLDSSLLRPIAADPAVKDDVVRVHGAATSILSFNLSREPFTDPLVREAFAYAFDRETYCALLRDGGCIPALSWIPPGLPAAITTQAYGFDLERARQALARSTYGGPAGLPEISFVFWAEDSLVAERVEWIAGQYRDILGVEIALQPLEGKTLVAMTSTLETYPQLAFDGWVQDYPDPQNWLSVYWTCGTGFAAAFGYCNPEFDTLTARADRELDPAARLALYEEAGRLLVADVPAVFVSHGVFFYLVNPEVTGYVSTPGDAGWPGQTASLLTVNVSH